jgi:hypothetical protein
MIAVAPQSNGADFKSIAEVLVEEVSPSRLKRWLTCKLSFFFHYVAQIRKASAIQIRKLLLASLATRMLYKMITEASIISSSRPPPSILLVRQRKAVLLR